MIMNTPDRRVRVIFSCRRGHEHELCVSIERQVPPELRCTPDTDQGYGPGGGGGCMVPDNLSDVVQRELRDAFQESKRRGHVLIHE